MLSLRLFIPWGSKVIALSIREASRAFLTESQLLRIIDYGPLKIRCTLTGLSLWFCVHKRFLFLSPPLSDLSQLLVSLFQEFVRAGRQNLEGDNLRWGSTSSLFDLEAEGKKIFSPFPQSADFPAFHEKRTPDHRLGRLRTAKRLFMTNMTGLIVLLASFVVISLKHYFVLLLWQEDLEVLCRVIFTCVCM